MKRYRNKEWLMHQYIDKKLSTLKIAELENVHRDTILYNLKLFKIPRRSLSDAFKLRKMSDEQKRKQSDRLKGVPLSVEHCKNISIGKTGKPLSEKHKKILSKNHANVKGENNPMFGKRGKFAPNWHGGISFGNYCIKFNKQFKNNIRIKFDNICFLCGKSEKENGRSLDIHHIDYNKTAICNGKEWAFVPLCRSCHSKTNVNRYYYFNLLINYWAIEYSSILETL